jgi:hypothetical protein
VCSRGITVLMRYAVHQFTFEFESDAWSTVVLSRHETPAAAIAAERQMKKRSVRSGVWTRYAAIDTLTNQQVILALSASANRLV